MSGWAARRFWTEASAVPVTGGFAVHLDARPLRTPQKVALVLPTLSLAQAVAAEWQAQDTRIDPETMPFTRTANSAIDKVAPQFDAVAEMLSAYGQSDLLCYRAEGPAGLVARQTEAWDPLLDWARDALGAPLVATVGVMPVAQSPDCGAAFRAELGRQSPFQLAAFHDLVTLSGSLVLALAVTHQRMSAEAAWTLSRVDEEWQIALWGADEEAEMAAARKRAAFLHADRFYRLCG